jgi:hypothetical protein
VFCRVPTTSNRHYTARGSQICHPRADDKRLSVDDDPPVVSELLVIGFSHKSATLEVRERLALPLARASEFMRDGRGAGDIHEAVVLSTCNRTELYQRSLRRPPDR